MQPNQLKDLAKSNSDKCQFVSKELSFLSRRLKKTDPEQNPDMFGSNIVESQFLLSGIAIAQKSFSKMIANKEANPDDEKTLQEYFLDEIDSMYKNNKEEDKGSEDVDND